MPSRVCSTGSACHRRSSPSGGARTVRARASPVPDLSVVIPVYNEEENLPLLWEELRGVLEGLGLVVEVIFVDDGSRDGSPEIVRGLREADPRVRLVRLKSHAGETAATDAGLKAALGRWVVVMDADLQNDPADIPKLLGYLDRWDRAFVAFADLLAIRWMKSRLLRYEVAESLGGDLGHE